LAPSWSAAITTPPLLALLMVVLQHRIPVPPLVPSFKSVATYVSQPTSNPGGSCLNAAYSPTRSAWLPGASLLSVRSCSVSTVGSLCFTAGSSSTCAIYWQEEGDGEEESVGLTAHCTQTPNAHACLLQVRVHCTALHCTALHCTALHVQHEGHDVKQGQ
jgi:hypothetical protein